MDDLDVKILLSLAKTGNLTHTAAQLYMGQSALTKRLQRVERELGADLFVRSHTGIMPTPIGERTIETLQRVDREMQNLREFIQASQGYVGGSLKVVSSMDYSKYCLPKVLETYARAFPRVNLQVETSHSRMNYQRLMKNECQVAIIRGEYEWDGEKHLLSSEPICLIRSKADAGKPLSQLRYISRYSDGNHMTLQTRWLMENNLSPESTLHVDTIGTCAKLTQQGLGWSIVPAICLGDFDGEVTPLYLANGKALVRNTYVMYRKNDGELPQVREFVRVVRELAENATQPGREE